jgi:D-amino-acid oxidase
MAYLAEEFAAAGGTEVRADVGSLDDLRDADVVVNCAGLDARQLAHDPSVRAIRGQVLVVRDVPYEHDTLYFLDQGAAFEREPVYIVPRGPDVVLGGTADPVGPELASLRAAAALRPSDEVTARIIRRCALLRPEFAGTREFTAKVGLRPFRPQVRIEWDGTGFRRPVVHCYGHGGGGVTLSWGSALRVADLVDRNH